MKYTTEIDINLSRDRVIELFDSVDNMAKWQPGFISFDHISGEPGQPGAKSLLKYQMGKREVEMIETITKRDLPNEFSGTYDAKGVKNIIKNYFHEAGPEQTRWISENEFQLNGMMKLMGWVMPGAFKKQTIKFMTLFKEFAEEES